MREQVDPRLSFFTNVSPSPSLEFSTYHSLPLYLSFRLLSVPLALPLARSSLLFCLAFSFSLSLSLPLSLSLSLYRAFFFALALMYLRLPNR